MKYLTYLNNLLQSFWFTVLATTVAAALSIKHLFIFTQTTTTAFGLNMESISLWNIGLTYAFNYFLLPLAAISILLSFLTRKKIEKQSTIISITLVIIALVAYFILLSVQSQYISTINAFKTLN